jgi:MFS family permease
MSSLKRNAPTGPKLGHGVGFWVVAFAFTAVMAFTTAPTPLWSLFAARDHFSSFTVTLVFAVYAVAVAVSLFFVGHLSDWHGRRRVLAPALMLNILAGIVFVLWPQLAGIVVARIISGLGVGAVTATATAWLAELDQTSQTPAGGGRARVVAVAANLAGLGLGGLIAGALAQCFGQPLTIPFLVLIGILVLATFGVLVSPETLIARSPRPRYRPQRVTVPERSRRRFFAAGIAAAIAFALFGLVTSLAPTFLAETLHEHSLLLAGAVSFAMFAAAALAQTLTPSYSSRQLITAAVPTLLVGIGLLTLAVWLSSPSFAIFVAGDLIAGVGAGLIFKGAIGTISEISTPGQRAEALAGLYLAAYLGLAGPVIGLGALTQVASTRVSLLAFSAALAAGIIAAAPTLLASRRSASSDNPSLDRRSDNHAGDHTQNHTTRPDRPRDNSRRVRRLGDRRRRLGVRLGTAGRRSVDRRDPPCARARD